MAKENGNVIPAARQKTPSFEKENNHQLRHFNLPHPAPLVFPFRCCPNLLDAKMTWELTRRRFIRAINSKYIYDRIVCPLPSPLLLTLQKTLLLCTINTALTRCRHSCSIRILPC